MTVRLPDELAGVGDVQLTLTLRGTSGNSAFVSIKTSP
jgi:hypothetical protein